MLDRLGFSIDELHAINPRLVVLSITGFGHDGPEGGRAGYDQIAQGEAGLMSLTGNGPHEPMKVGVPIGDLLAGMYGAYGVVAALHERERTGQGRHVRTSLLAAIVGVHAYQGTRWTVAGEVPTAIGNQHPSISPYGLFHTADAPIQVACGSEGLWRAFAPVVGLDPDDRRFASNRMRVERREELTGPHRGCARPSTAPSTGCPSWPTPASLPARSAPSTTSTPGSRPGRRVWSSRSTIRRSARSSCPDRRCASTTSRTPEDATRTDRRPGSASTTTPCSRGSSNVSRAADRRTNVCA